jgi:hypothetical protein
MTNQHQPEDIHAINENSLRSLVRTITVFQEHFLLVLLRCNYTVLRQQITDSIHRLCPIEIREITLQESVKTLYTAISEQIGDEQPAALMVFGLEFVEDLDTILISANQVREEFKKTFSFPIILWVDNQVLKKNY